MRGTLVNRHVETVDSGHLAQSLMLSDDQIIESYECIKINGWINCFNHLKSYEKLIIII